MSQLGIVNYSFTGGLAKPVGDYTNSMSIIAYTGNGGTLQTPWKYKQTAPSPNLYTGNLKGYIIGGLPSGNNFITTGPSQIDMILRDPAGSNSYSYFEQGSTVTKTSSTTVSDALGTSISSDFMLGGTVSTFAGVGAGVIINTSTHNTTTVGLEKTETYINDTTTTSTITNTKRWQTSNTQDFVDALGDVYIGNSTNIVYGKCTFIELLLPTEGLGHTGATVSGYRMGKYVGVRVNPEFKTAFQYSQNHIKNYLIPNFVFLRDNYLQTHTGAPFFYNSKLPVGDALYGSNNTPRETVLNTNAGNYYGYTIPATWPSDSLFTDTIRYYNQQISQWKKILEQNEREKVQATLIENLSYDAGVIYESSETHTTTVATTRTFEWQLSPKLANQTGFDVSKLGVTINFETTSNNVNTDASGTETTSSVTFGYVLNDNDAGDYFSVDVKAPKSHTGPIFAIRGGQSMCPFEHAEVTEFFQPGTIISESVMQREVPGIACNIPVQINVPEDQKALFQVQLMNMSQTNDDMWFMVTVDQQSNQNGAKVSIDGQSVANGRVIFIPGGASVNKLITIEKIDPAVNDYTDIGIILHSVCQFDPSSDWPNISDTVKLTARFKPVCSGVQITSPGDLWVDNTNTNPANILPIIIDNYNLAHTGFEKIIFQYKPNSTSAWTGDMVYYMNSVAFATAPAPKTLIAGAPILNYNWDMNSLQDRNYQIRAITTCADGTTNESTTLSGIKDTKRPKIFGTPQPGDGILSPGDNIMLTFDETIAAGLLLNSNFSVRGVLNGATIRHNSALYFNGISDYATVISGVNLQDKSFTVEFWTKRGDLTPGVIFEQAGIQLGFDATNKFYAKLGSQTQASTQAYNFIDKWIHFAVNFDYSTKMLAIYSAYSGSNTIEKESVNFPISFIGKGRMYLGKNQTETAFFNGYLHDFRIWESVKGYGTVNSNKLTSMNGEEIGLGGMWPMNEAQGNYAQDLSRSHHAMLEGASWKVFPTGNARTFSGTSHLDFPTASSVIITNEMDMTLEFWFNAPTQINTILFSNGKGDGTDGTAAISDIWMVGINGSGEIYAKNNGTSITAVAEDFLDNNWHHFALVLNRNGNTSLYIDGNLKKYEHSSNFGGLKGANMTIGASRHFVNGTPYTNYFTGSIDELRIWKLARTSKLLKMDMNSKLTGKEKGLVAYYPFDKYDINLILQPTLADCDINDNTGVLTGNIATATGGAFNNTNVPNIKDARPVQNLAFNSVVNNDKIIINIEEPADLIEKCIIEFTVDRVEDLQENRMASPVNWTAYIKKNTVIWDQTQLNFQKELYAPLSFNVDILNLGGIEQNFTISNLPPWLTADVTTGNLLPDSRKIIHFTVAQSTNIGNYDLSLFLTSDFGYSEKLELNIKVFKTPPVWVVNPTNYQYSMSLIGQVKIDGIFATNTDDKVAAFVGNQCRGIANLQYLAAYDMFEVFLNIYSNIQAGEQVTFRIWNATEGIVHNNVTPELIFEQNTFRGTPSAPQILETSNSYNSEIPFVNGWKWISFNVADPNLSNVNTLFANINAQPGNLIKGQTVFDNYGINTKWTGSLTNIGGFKKEQMYMVKLSQKDTLRYDGGKFDPLTSPITLNPGWNWIGYTPRVNIPLNTAMGNYNASPGDLIKSQYGFAMFDVSMGWLGSLNYMKPNAGYMYKNASVASTFVYPTAGLSPVFEAQENPIIVNGWNLIPENFQYSMSLVGEVILPNGSPTENHIVGAFSGSECRGIAVPVLINGKFKYFVTVYSNLVGENINFKVANISTNSFSEVQEQFAFGSNAIIGSLETPQILTVTSTTDISTIENQGISIYPNPSVGKFKINLIKNYNFENSTCTISDVTGKVIYNTKITKNETEIDLTVFGSGIYFVKVKTTNAVFTKRIVIQTN